MSYHIESYDEQPDPITFVCEDSDCGERWQGDVETQRCEAEHCDVITCPTCRTVCNFCGASLCSTHRVRYNDDGEQRWVCAECKSVAEARDREDGLQIRMAS